jgi:isopentenyl-diphosphate delta-isomerase
VLNISLKTKAWLDHLPIDSLSPAKLLTTGSWSLGILFLRLKSSLSKGETEVMQHNHLSRIARKLQHIEHSLNLGDGPASSGLEDLYLLHQAAPELNLAEVDLTVQFAGKTLAAPLLINALTGGNQRILPINQGLARVARECGIAMAVGSQTVALEDPAAEESFRIVREVNPAGVILANVGALTCPDWAMKAVEMIRADALQVHLNVAQELAMVEGDREFRGILTNLKLLAEQSPVPVMVKEVGFGLSRETVARLADTGIDWVDLGGQGGTNFIAIESQRGNPLFSPSLEAWGIPTAVSLLETVDLKLPLGIVASGGVRTALDAAKVLAVGADLAGIAGPALRILVQESAEALQLFFQQLLYELRCIYLMMGARNRSELRQKPVVILGKTREWLAERGIDATCYAQRKQ